MKAMTALLIGLAATPLWAQVGNSAKGQESVMLCVACHLENGGGKDNGEAVESWPRLAGLPEAYLTKQLHDIKNGTRQAPTMLAFANMLTDEQMADLSAYYAQLPPPDMPPPEATPEILAHGEKLALRGDWDRYLPPCMSCHGPNNQGAGNIFPGIAGQHAPYLRKQLELWQQDERKNDVNQLMTVIAKRLTAEDIQAVTLWLARQKPQGGQP